ncbi:hypothetical protein IAQ61_011680 [Plenodomus lingam]|uniref:uncharacterized protein n=1 Tax=Leptosphaeria maculans TaxID=5022 RepID=UPI00333344EA|nr:hypothetical protein IAQ61_011680 [Plenodomus lingam]
MYPWLSRAERFTNVESIAPSRPQWQIGVKFRERAKQGEQATPLWRNLVKQSTYHNSWYPGFRLSLLNWRVQNWHSYFYIQMSVEEDASKPNQYEALFDVKVFPRRVMFSASLRDCDFDLSPTEYILI